MRNATPTQALAEAQAVVAREANRLTCDNDPTTGVRLLLAAALLRLSRLSSREAAATLVNRMAGELQLGKL